MNFCIIYTLTNNEDEAKKIAHTLVKEKLAACCNIVRNVMSVYEWKEQICEDNEHLILIKTKKELFEEVKNCILKNHSCELPAIIMLPIETGSQKFLDWIGENTKNEI
ncbi:MAG TPA: divalent-cation tolerance protein CutA [Candidatus Gastranaerophilales bacterium]|nr:divalent-cation tolerance protein CutA [Candidatus Gastranaerophilales bacterium]